VVVAVEKLYIHNRTVSAESVRRFKQYIEKHPGADYREIGKATKTGESNVHSILKAMVDHGLIEKVPGEKHTPSKFYVAVRP
jgi:DNA-binding MarR family transcriptional regulator